jgi:hypothetical protein
LLYKTGKFALPLAVACALVVVAHLSLRVLVAVLVATALVRAAAALRREQHTLDRILTEELDPADDQIEAPVEIASRTSRPSVSRLVHPTRRLHRAS